ncbi:hypothetical protein A3758_10055 [Oleiphilus sp. HI0118]|nr:hypothetical protein A3758_10055 [Oleiphilus sp. HI0118]
MIARIAVLIFGMIPVSNLIADDAKFEAGSTISTRANDLLYGEALYEYHQGRFFESLTVLNVAKEKGGIQQHGDHPLLVEGGLMLAYGMTREAKKHFEALLSPDMTALVSADARNQAWFYLGKVFYLESDLVASQRALSEVNAERLLESDESLYLEWRYLNAQVLLREGRNENAVATLNTADAPTQKNATSYTHSSFATDDDSLSDRAQQNDLWSVYSLYNKALLSLDHGEDRAVVMDGLLAAQEQLKRISNQHEAESGSDEQAERAALRDRIYLSLGQISLQQNAFVEAVTYLQKVPYSSMVSDEALFQYAVAQSNLGQHELALAALDRLNTRTLFTPWLQQVPYALAFLYERLNEPALAAQAYRAAGDHYDGILKTIKEQQASLDEVTIIAALETAFSSSEDQSNDDYLNAGRLEPKRSQNSRCENMALTEALGEQSTQRDAYGRLRVLPSDFYLVNLLATEPFQMALRDLHELYDLQNGLRTWRSRLDSFALMLETRAAQRQSKLAAVRSDLTAQDAELWTLRFNEYKQAIDKALVDEDVRFFMDESQIAFNAQIIEAKETLKSLPAGEEQQEFSAKLARVQRYFDWWVADRYGVNRWAAQREISELGESIDEFEARRQYLQAEIENSAFQSGLESRVLESGVRLDTLASQIDVVLVATRGRLIEQVSRELDRQSSEVAQYRLAARHAQARLSDQLYRQRNEEQTEQSKESSDRVRSEGQRQDSALENTPLSAHGAQNDDPIAKKVSAGASARDVLYKEASA